MNRKIVCSSAVLGALGLASLLAINNYSNKQPYQLRPTDPPTVPINAALPVRSSYSRTIASILENRDLTANMDEGQKRYLEKLLHSDDPIDRLFMDNLGKIYPPSKAEGLFDGIINYTFLRSQEDPEIDRVLANMNYLDLRDPWLGIDGLLLAASQDMKYFRSNNIQGLMMLIEQNKGRLRK